MRTKRRGQVEPTRQTVLIELDRGDCLVVGLSLGTVAQVSAMPHETRRVYMRVGRQMVDAARPTGAVPTKGARR